MRVRYVRIAKILEILKVLWTKARSAKEEGRMIGHFQRNVSSWFEMRKSEDDGRFRVEEQIIFVVVFYVVIKIRVVSGTCAVIGAQARPQTWRWDRGNSRESGTGEVE